MKPKSQEEIALEEEIARLKRENKVLCTALDNMNEQTAFHNRLINILVAAKIISQDKIDQATKFLKSLN